MPEFFKDFLLSLSKEQAADMLMWLHDGSTENVALELVDILFNIAFHSKEQAK